MAPESRYKRQVRVVAGAIMRDGKVFAARRGNYGETRLLWEFPGGKPERGETDAEALARELYEELSVRVSVKELISAITDEYPTQVLHIYTYRCSLISGEPRLKEHLALGWFDAEELEKLRFSPADKPTLRKIKEDYLVDYRKKAAEIVGSLPLKEASMLVYGHGFWESNALPKRGIKSFVMSDGPHGLRHLPPGEGASGKSLPATCFPTASCLACSFDQELAYEIGEAIGEEAINQGVDVVLGPGVNIKRSPLCGRNFEYFSEDPLLSGKLGAAFVRGVQSTGVAATVKHFACNDQETNRMLVNAAVDERALREIYLRQFETVVKEAAPAAVMCAYNKLNGDYCSDSRHLLTDILRKEWGYGGLVMSDWGAMNDPAKAYGAGLDLEMPCLYDKSRRIMKEIRKGIVLKEEVRRSATEVAALALKLADERPDKRDADYDKHFLLAEKAAAESQVLVKNSMILPFDKNKRLCVIGAYAKEPRYQGGGSSQVNAFRHMSFLGALDKAGIAYDFAAGYLGDGKDDPALIKEAAGLAQGKDQVVVFLGLPEAIESEGYDRSDLLLPKGQLELIEALTKVTKKAAVVIQSGAPVQIPFYMDVGAILISHLAGEASGPAVRDVLFGRVNPSGRLAETWMIDAKDNIFSKYFPGTRQNVIYKDSVFVGYRYYDAAGKPVMFPFGFGLSYSKFAYSDYRISYIDERHYEVAIKVRNVEGPAGHEVVQLYVGQDDPKTIKPVRELKAFRKIFLRPGEEKEVRFVIATDELRHYDLESRMWVLEAGTYRFEIGASSRDIKASVKVSIASKDFVSDYREICPSYFHLDAAEDVTDAEFAALYQDDLPRDVPIKKPYTRNSTIGDIKDTFIGKMLVDQAVKGFVSGTDEALKRLVLASLYSTPLRSATMSGMLTDEGVDGIVDLANGKKARGASRLLRGRIHK